MPFTLSLKPQQTEVVLPRYEFTALDDAVKKSEEILKHFPGLYYVGILFFDEITPDRLITNILQKGFMSVTWTQYKMHDRAGRIKDYFILNGYNYVKLKPIKYY